MTVCTARIEHILYHGGQRGSDYCWVVRSEDGSIIRKGNSSGLGWAQSDCQRGGSDEELLTIDFNSLPEPIAVPYTHIGVFRSIDSSFRYPQTMSAEEFIAQQSLV